MKSSSTLAAAVLALAAVLPASAEEYSTDILDFVSYRTRDEVRAELFAYKKAGVNPWSMAYNPLKYFRSVAHRGDVVAGYFDFREEAVALYGQDSGSAYLCARGMPGGAVFVAGSLPTRLGSMPGHGGDAFVSMPSS